MNQLELLEVRGCSYADYANHLAHTLAAWRTVPGCIDVMNRKGWEFVTMAYFGREYAKHEGEPMGRVLDAACGRESLVNFLSMAATTVIATDLWEPAYLKAAGIELEDFLTFWRALPNVFPMQMDSTRLQFNDNFFDAVFCVSSIEHIGSENGNHEGAVRAMREMIRVTKPGGLVAFSTELHPDERHDAWWFSREGLDRFIANLTGNATKLNVTVADGAAEGFPLYPVAFAMRKL